jgi:hypothetical protein
MVIFRSVHGGREEITHSLRVSSLRRLMDSIRPPVMIRLPHGSSVASEFVRVTRYFKPDLFSVRRLVRIKWLVPVVVVGL